MNTQYEMSYVYTPKHEVIAFVGVNKKDDGYRKTIDVEAIVQIGFLQGLQKLNYGSGKTIHRGTTYRRFTARNFQHIFFRISCGFLDK
jgi:hypothetical protein